MSRSASKIGVKIYRFPSNPDFQKIDKHRLLDKVRKTDAQARKKGLETLDSKKDPLVPLGMELDAKGRVTKNGYGVLHLPWLAQENPAWPSLIEHEVNELKERIRQAHGSTLRYVIWAGMGGSAEDKAFYLSARLLGRRCRVYICDSTDPAKLASILAHIEKMEKGPLDQALKKTLVVGMAMGMTSYEPVVNLEKLDLLYKKLRIENTSNFIYLTLPGSILDEFGRERGFRRIPLQPDDGNSTAGRHSGPMTRGSLYPLALSGVSIADWMNETALTDKEVRSAFELAGFIQGNAAQGRDKVVWNLPSQWKGGLVWTKQDFEESLGKSEEIGTKIVIDEPLKPGDYYSPKSPKQDRCFVFVNVAGLRNVDPQRVTALRRAGYPVAVIQIEDAIYPVARYMQFIHYVVFGLGWLRKMNFVTQPGVELYKQYASKINDEATERGGIEKTDAWKGRMESPHRIRWARGLSVGFDSLVDLGLLDVESLSNGNRNAVAVYAAALDALEAQGKISYGELTFFGDTRYDEDGKKLLAVLKKAGGSLFRSQLKMPVDVYEGPAMNHSFHEMIIGYGRGFSTVILSEKQSSIRKVAYRSDYHRAQWLATEAALADRGRAVVTLTVRDLSERSLEPLAEFFKEAARRIKPRRG